MEFREYPLLNTPNMSVVVLKTARNGRATVEDCAQALEAMLDRADEHPPFAREEVRRRLDLIVGYLDEARLLSRDAEGHFGLTPRGRKALAEHPQGFTRADLMAFPEFARYILAVAQGRSEADPRMAAHDLGFAAYQSGALPSDNPYGPDTIDHLAWENGWFDAMDAMTG